MIDFHNHLVPGVDDGAATLEESREALAAFAAQGVRTVIVTPHYRASVAASGAEREAFFALVDPAWERLREMAAAEFPALRLERGAEVALDTPHPDLSDARIRLAGTRFVLVEFPFMSIPPNADTAVFDLKMRGWTPVIAHPERYANLAEDLRAAAEWKRVGAYLQVNCASLLGRYGAAPKKLAWELVRRGMADFLSSDYHARGHPRVAEARAALEEAGGERQAELLLAGNAARMLAGEAPEPVDPLEKKSGLWGRLFGRG